MEIKIRSFIPEDLPRLCEIAAQAWKPIFAGFKERLGAELFNAYLGEDWETRKADEITTASRGEHGARITVALLNSEIAGFVVYYAHADIAMGEISNNAVDPRMQNRGIATELYRHVLAAMRLSGIRFVKVSTGADPGHAPARRAYEKAGFSNSLQGTEYFMKL